MKHGVSLFFFFLTPLFSVLCSGRGCEDELAARSGSGLLIFSTAAGTGVVFLSPRRSEGGLAPGSGAGYPSGVVVAGPRSIELHMGSVSVGTVSIFVCLTCGAKV